MIIIIISVCGLFLSGFSSAGINFVISLAVIFVILSICKTNITIVRKLYKTIFAFSIISVASIYYEFLVPESFFAIAKNILSVGSYNTLVHVYSVSNAYCGLSGYSSLSAFSCVILCACTFSKLFVSTNVSTIKNKVLNIAGFLAALFALILTTKRSLFIAIIVAALLVFVLTKNLKRSAKYSLLLLAAVGVFVLFYFVRDSVNVISFLQRFQYSNNADFSSGRNEIIEKAINYLGSEWLFGFGTGTGAIYSNSLGVGGGLHNIYLQILFENGVPGLIAWIYLFIKNLKDVLAFRYDQSRPYVMTAIFMQICFFIYGFFGNPLYDLCIFGSYIISTVLPIYTINEKSID